jgi:hypothetical protein
MIEHAHVCEWCGEPHDVGALCTSARPRMSRRSFLFLAGAGTAALVVAPSLPDLLAFGQVPQAGVNQNLGWLVAEAWNKVMGDGEPLGSNVFLDQNFVRLMRDELQRLGADSALVPFKAKAPR